MPLASSLVRAMLVLSPLFVFACGDDDGASDSDVPTDVAVDVPVDVAADVPAEDTGADDSGADDSGVEDTGVEDAGDCVPAGGSVAIVPGAPSCCPGLMNVGCEVPSSTGCMPCAGASFCTDCGNGTCDEGENVCRCPADCS